ncbi:hypothetical protein Cob_v003167 [Colletotrichum orbiculare MAFF 240422]|uniref:Uncharacterized protein n=1 Tax=Colletotrichum orbiculare (strain 104-T / ATCC 96160 / CBS 514.97 / LARS 414 / MAFF 240422) TaxID=1213857 RepID=A0A484G001_COLOR|nr:hypothetical protein Cob_v003167 [Colletotrichum orbiculare MAFF 240422]
MPLVAGVDGRDVASQAIPARVLECPNFLLLKFPRWSQSTSQRAPFKFPSAQIPDQTRPDQSNPISPGKVRARFSALRTSTSASICTSISIETTTAIVSSAPSSRCTTHTAGTSNTAVPQIPLPNPQLLALPQF